MNPKYNYAAFTVVAVSFGILAVATAHSFYSRGFLAGQKSVQSGTLTISDSSFIGCKDGAGLIAGLKLRNAQILDNRTPGACHPKAISTVFPPCIDGWRICENNYSFYALQGEISEKNHGDYIRGSDGTISAMNKTWKYWQCVDETWSNWIIVTSTFFNSPQLPHCTELK